MVEVNVGLRDGERTFYVTLDGQTIATLNDAAAVARHGALDPHDPEYQPLYDALVRTALL